MIWLWKVWFLLIAWFDLPQLTDITTGKDSFQKTKSVSFAGMANDDWFIWTSSSYWFHCGRRLLHVYCQFHFGEYDDWWLINWIFLSWLHSSQDLLHSKKQSILYLIVKWLMIDWLDLPHLMTFTPGNKTFYEVKTLVLLGLIIFSFFIRGSFLYWFLYTW